MKTRADADRPDLATEVERAGLVYFSGGNPKHLGSTTRIGALAGAERGARPRCRLRDAAPARWSPASPAPRRKRRVGASWTFGLGLVPHVSFGVHWDRMGKIPAMRWWVTSRIPESSWFVGIDERTAILGDGERWTVFGCGGAMVVHSGSRPVYRAGETFETPERA